MPQLKPANEPFYAIRQKSTQFFLPAGGKGMRGHTHQEPSATRPPRLFVDSKSAARALLCYLQGKWVESTYYDYEGTPDSSGPEPKKHTTRDHNDFELVKLQLTVLEN